MPHYPRSPIARLNMRVSEPVSDMKIITLLPAKFVFSSNIQLLQDLLGRKGRGKHFPEPPNNFCTTLRGCEEVGGRSVCLEKSIWSGKYGDRYQMEQKYESGRKKGGKNSEAEENGKDVGKQKERGGLACQAIARFWGRFPQENGPLHALAYVCLARYVFLSPWPVGRELYNMLFLDLGARLFCALECAVSAWD